MQANKIASRDEWLIARKAHLLREKELTRLRDQVSAERRQLPWVKIEKTYVFDTPDGRKTLRELFDGRSQLIVYHFMFGPGWKEGCDGCSFLADHIDCANLHLAHHDVSLVVVARAWPTSRHSKSAWAGGSRGWRPMAATSTTTSTSPRMKP